MIHPVGIPIRVLDETLAWAYSHMKNPGQAFGLAVDDLVKHHAWRELPCTIPPKFAHYDLQMGDLKVEVKSTSAKTFTFSMGEFDYIEEQVLADRQYKVLFYVNDLQALTTTYVGSLNASKMFEANLFEDSKLNPNQKMVYLDKVLSCLG